MSENAAVQGTRIELCASALRRNLRFIRGRIGDSCELCSVVKGDAYGHGISTFVPLAESCGVRNFACFSAAEAQRVLASFSRADSSVMIMGDIEDHELPWAVQQGVAFWVFDIPRLEAAVEAARSVGGVARVHLELETCLNRTGLDLVQLEEAAGHILAAGPSVLVEGVCTHLAGAESVANLARIQAQLERFESTAVFLRERGIHPRLRHTACSAAALRYPETSMDMVRIGIAQYGFWPSAEIRIDHLQRQGDGPGRPPDPLRRVLRWCSRIMSLKQLPRGQFVGYGTAYLTSRRQRIAVVPVGYAHGYFRSLSNQGHVLVRGRRAPVVGLVNMNMLMVDVTDCPGVGRGDEVVVVGKQGRREITVASFSDWTRLLNYELLTRISADIPRVVVR